MRKAVISETPAPVLYMTIKSTWSRNPTLVEASGATSSRCICFCVRCPTVVCSNRFTGIESNRCAIGNNKGSTDATYRMNERIAASLALRLRGPLSRRRSRSAKNAKMQGASKSATRKSSTFVPSPPFEEANEQLEGVTIGVDGLGTEVALANEVLAEILLQSRPQQTAPLEAIRTLHGHLLANAWRIAQSAAQRWRATGAFP